MELSVILVNYKTPKLTTECIRSIYAETSGFKFEIIVVDNNSNDNSKELILSNFPDILYVQMNENIGFGAGNNVGIEKAKGKYILLLNTDTVIINSAINKAVEFLKNDHKADMLGCQLLNKDNTDQDSYYPITTWPDFNKLLNENLLIYRLRKLFKGANIIHDQGLFNQPFYTDSIKGAFMLFKRKMLNFVEPFDPDFFMYFEEIEWANRLKNRGIKIVFVPSISVIHFGQESSNPRFINNQLALSLNLFFLKRYGRGGYLLYLVINYFNIITNMLFYIYVSKESKSIFIKNLKQFAFSSLLNFKILFKYSKKFNSSKHPLKY